MDQGQRCRPTSGAVGFLSAGTAHAWYTVRQVPERRSLAHRVNSFSGALGAAAVATGGHDHKSQAPCGDNHRHVP